MEINKENNKNLVIIKNLLLIITFFLSLFILKTLKTILIPFTLAFIVFLIFKGVKDKLSKKGLPSGIASFLTFMIIIILTIIINAFIYFGAINFINRAPEYAPKVNEYIKSTANILNFNYLEIKDMDMQDIVNKIDIGKATSYISSIISTTLGSFTSLISNFTIFTFFLIFMLAGSNSLDYKIDKAFKGDKAKEISKLIYNIEQQTRKYLFIKTVISLITAIISGILLMFLGVDFLIFTMLLIFFLNYIPNVGSIIATIFPVSVSLFQYGFGLKTIFVILVLSIIQMIMGNVVEPALTGKSLNLSPLFILFSLIIWGWIWGIIGMIIAIPLSMIIKIVLDNIPSLKGISILIGDK